MTIGDPRAFEDAPVSEQVTEYDEQHFEDYLRLLDAHKEGADWREAVTHIFGINPDEHSEKVRRFHDTHLARAQWMTRIGYRQLAERGHEKPHRPQK